MDHTIPSESRAQFMAVEEKLETAARKSPGCLSVGMEELPSDNAAELHFRTTMEFDSQNSMIAWIDSDTRHDLVHQARETFQYGYALRSKIRSFDSWFPKPKDTPPPPVWKMNLLVLLTLYPTLLVLRPIVGPYTQDLPFRSSVLIGNVLSVAITGWLLMPLVNKLFAPWLRGRGDLLGALVVVLAVFAFWALAGLL